VKNNSEEARKKRHDRIRLRLSGVPERPRLCVFRSDRHIAVQIIDDTTGKVLASASSLSKEFKAQGLSRVRGCRAQKPSAR
jgi:large subunit ribosomal protein L18